MRDDPLHRLPALRALREQLHGAPPGTAQRAELVEALAAAVLATRPPPREHLPARLRAALATCVLLVGAAGYAVTGNWPAWQYRPPADPGELMVQRLADRLAANPGAATASDWAMLGRSLTVLGKQAEAVDAYRRALALEPGADLMAALADLLASGQGGRFAGEPAQLIAQALGRSPDHPQALALAAAQAWQEGRANEARGYWRRLKAVVPADDPLSAAADRGLALPAMHQP